MNVYISHSRYDADFAHRLSSSLEEEGHDVFTQDKIVPGSRWSDAIAEGMARSEAVIVLISEHTDQSVGVSNDINLMLSLYGRGKIFLVLPVLIGKNAHVLPSLQIFQYIQIPLNEDMSMDKSVEANAIEKIKLALAMSEKNKKIEAEKAEEKIEQVKAADSSHIDKVVKKLEDSEKANKRYAFCLYVTSIVPMIATIWIFARFILREDLRDMTIEYVLTYGIVLLIIAAILVSLSKLLFTLAKSFMVEAVRCSDREHAISFGKFFLEAYGSEASRDEVFKAFSAWNIDNGSTAFRNQSSDDYDPKLWEKAALFFKANKDE